MDRRTAQRIVALARRASELPTVMATFRAGRRSCAEGVAGAAPRGCPHRRPRPGRSGGVLDDGHRPRPRGRADHLGRRAGGVCALGARPRRRRRRGLHPAGGAGPPPSARRRRGRVAGRDAQGPRPAPVAAPPAHLRRRHRDRLAPRRAPRAGRAHPADRPPSDTAVGRAPRRRLPGPGLRLHPLARGPPHHPLGRPRPHRHRQPAVPVRAAPPDAPPRPARHHRRRRPSPRRHLHRRHRTGPRPRRSTHLAPTRVHAHYRALRRPTGERLHKHCVHFNRRPTRDRPADRQREPAA